MTETLSPTLPPAVEHKVETVLRIACAESLTLATAESCTGGLFASVLTDVDGRAHAFERGFVTYTDQAKAQVLGVPATLLESQGAVSAPVARAMAEGAVRASEADIALSVTGFAGRGAPDDEAGLVFLAVARRDGPVTVTEHHFGDVGRGAVRIACLDAGLDMLLATLGHGDDRPPD
ncbi:CinA family protein [uncultured Caulobacter sp.]|uniref:CinA family protein n=1 Tax=uncultured Caulobacter sp. TaxID=158749 RepID=UPI002620790E|nr:CinA family protein [uncultured Caulobacter sp.]